MASKGYSVDMCEGSLGRKMIVYTIPIILSSVLQLMFNTINLVVVGQFCDSLLSVGAIGATSSLNTLIVSLFLGLSVGSSVTAAQGIGAEDNTDVFRTVHTSVLLAVIGGFVLSVIGVIGAETFLRMMDTPENVLPLSTRYMRVYFCGMIPSMVYNFGSAVLRAAGDTRGPFVYLLIAGAINVLLNLFFILVCGMNVGGVALATVISQTVSAVLVVAALMRREDSCRLALRDLRIYKKNMLKILKIGLPSGVQNSVFCIAGVLFQSSINSFGEIVLAGDSAASNIEGFLYVATNAFHQTALIFAGQNAGAKKFNRVSRVLVLNLIMVSVMSIGLGWTARYFGKELLGIYITDSPQAIEYGLIRMTYICLPYLLQGLMDVTSGAIQGLGAATMTMLISVFGICGFRIAWIYTAFRANPVINCLYLAFPLSWFMTMVVQFVAYFYVIRRKKASVQKEMVLSD